MCVCGEEKTGAGGSLHTRKKHTQTYLQRFHRIIPFVPQPFQRNAHGLALARRVDAPPASVRHRARAAHPPTAVAPHAAAGAHLRVANLVLDQLRVVRDVGFGVVVPERLRRLRDRVARRAQLGCEFREKGGGRHHVGVQAGYELGVGDVGPPGRRHAAATVDRDGAVAINLAQRIVEVERFAVAGHRFGAPRNPAHVAAQRAVAVARFAPLLFEGVGAVVAQVDGALHAGRQVGRGCSNGGGGHQV